MSLNFELSEENILFAQAVEKALKPWATDRKTELDQMVKDHTFPEELWQTFAELGILGCLIPEEYGGTSAGLVNQCLAFEKITQMNISPNILLATCMDSAVIAGAGSESLKQQHLPGIASGEKKYCFALTEANAGTNTFAIETHAKKQGDSYIINGSKTFISGFDDADYMILAVRTTPLAEAQDEPMGTYHGMTFFMVPTHAPGITKQALSMAFNEGVTQYTLFFDNVEIHESQVIGEVDQAVIVMFTTLNPERILAAAICSGISSFCINSAVQYAKERTVFGKTPIGTYQGIAHPITECEIHHQAARNMMLKAAWAFDNGEAPAQVGTLANMCKYLNSECAIKAADACIETFGGAGFTEEWGFLNQWNGARLFKTVPISKAMLLNFVAEHHLGLPKSY